MSLVDSARRIVVRAFTQDIGLKLLSLATAIFLFSLVRGSEDHQRAIYVDVTVIPPPPESGKMLVSELPDRVKVTLRGSRSQLTDIILTTVDMDVRDPSLRYFYFEPAAFDLPPGVSVVSLAPASVPLVWEDRAERRVPIAAKMVGGPRAGLQLGGEPQVEPRTVRVSGPERELSPVDVIYTEPIDFGEMGEGEHRVRVRLDRPPNHSDYPDVAAVEVTFEIVPEVATRSLSALTIVQVGGATRAQIRPPEVQVRLRGVPAPLRELSEERVVPYVDVSSIAPGGGAHPVDVQVQPLPDGIEVESIEPARVLVSF